LGIALQSGHFWETIWEDPANAELRARRQIPNVLYEGDIVFVSPLRRKEEPGVTETRHRFRRLGEPSRLRIVVLNVDEPRRNEPYRLVIDGEQRTGVLNERGELDVPVPGDARQGELYVGEGEDEEKYTIGLGTLSPLDTVRGIQERLANLGFQCGGVTGKMNARTRGALARFQARNGLPPTGKADPTTRQELKDAHDG
jgi:N-acetylmuramoyl-L-alanine amidase